MVYIQRLAIPVDMTNQKTTPKFKITDKVSHVLESSFIGLVNEIRERENSSYYYTITHFVEGKPTEIVCPEYELKLAEDNGKIGFKND